MRIAKYEIVYMYSKQYTVESETTKKASVIGSSLHFTKTKGLE